MDGCIRTPSANRNVLYVVAFLMGFAVFGLIVFGCFSNLETDEERHLDTNWLTVNKRLKEEDQLYKRTTNLIETVEEKLRSDVLSIQAEKWIFSRSEIEAERNSILFQQVALARQRRFLTRCCFGAAAICAVYFVPAFAGRKKRNFIAIFVLNLLTGWTGLGWAISLVWALTVDPKD